jgi:FkbM family methyltransferase
MQADKQRKCRPAGCCLKFSGRFVRALPYFRGKWRLLNFVFHRYFRHQRIFDEFVLRNGMSIHCNLWDEVQFDIWAHDANYERPDSHYLLRHLQAGMVFFDVGANVGYYTLMAAPMVNRDGAVHAFEPMPDTFSALCANIQRNGLDWVKANRMIVSDSPGVKMIHAGPEDNAGQASVEIVYRPEEKAQPVEAITLDDYVKQQQVKRLDLVKIDVEGHELAVLHGMAGTLAALKPTLMVEVRESNLRQSGHRREEIYDFLGQQGYKPFRVKPDVSLEPILTPVDGRLIIFKPSQ